MTDSDKQKVTLIDMDSVIVDFENGFREKWQRKYPHRICIPTEERRAHALEDDYPKEFSDDINALMAEEKFFSDLLPIPGAVEAMHNLVRQGYNVIICTRPLYAFKNCINEKYDWVHRHLGIDFVQRMMPARDKTLVFGHILIDDMPYITGRHEPSWHHILYDQPYNRNVVDRKRLTWENYEEVIKEVLQKTPDE